MMNIRNVKKFLKKIYFSKEKEKKEKLDEKLKQDFTRFKNWTFFTFKLDLSNWNNNK